MCIYAMGTHLIGERVVGVVRVVIIVELVELMMIQWGENFVVVIIRHIPLMFLLYMFMCGVEVRNVIFWRMG